MQFAKRKCWINPLRCLCELEEDGSVTFIEDITIEEYRLLVKGLLQEAEIQRQRRLEDILEWRKN